MKFVKNIFGGLLLLLSLGAVIFAVKLNTIFQFGGSYGIETNEEIIDFKLKNINGGYFQLNDIKGNLVYLYFGYTNCPNLCRLRMSNLLQLSKKITRKDIRYIYITIDPAEDTETKLIAFSKELGEKFLVLYGNAETIKTGDVQVMSAGTGIRHSEFNPNANQQTKLFQIWLFPKVRNVEPRYQQITLDKSLEKNDFAQVLSPNADDAGVWIHQDAWFYLSDFDKGFSKKLSLKKMANRNIV